MTSSARFPAASALRAAAVAILFAATPAVASDIIGRDVAVRFEGAEAHTVEGATLLLRRIAAAAARVCAPLDHGDLLSRRRREGCEQQLTADAVSRVGSPTLAVLHESSRRELPRVIAQRQ